MRFVSAKHAEVFDGFALQLRIRLAAGDTRQNVHCLWLAALRAMEEMAKLQNDGELAVDLHRLFEQGSCNYDRLLWNGEYYIQQIDPSRMPDNARFHAPPAP